MSRSPSSFQLPRVSRTATRLREVTPRWSIALSTAGFCLLLTLAILSPWMTDEAHGGYEGLRRTGYAAVLLLAIVAAQPLRHPERLLAVPLPLLAALAWCGLSLGWAIEPAVGLRRLLLTVMVAWSLFALVRQLGPERTILVMRVLLTVTLVANFLIVLFDPATGIHPVSQTEPDLIGDWRGFLDHKNFAGLVSAMTILVYAFCAEQVPLALRAIVTAAASVFLLLTDSATSLGMSIAGVATGFGFQLLAKRRGARTLLPSAWALVLLPVVGLVFLSMALTPTAWLVLLSNPAGFTGRMQIWSTLIRAFVDRPWLGIGYGSFWDLGSDGPVNTYVHSWVATMSQGHNGYLDLLVQIGAIGALIVIYATLVWPIERLLRGGDHPARPLGAAILLFCIGHNFTESQLFDRDQLSQVFMMIAIALLWTVTAAVEVDAPADASGTAPEPGESARQRAPLRLNL